MKTRTKIVLSALASVALAYGVYVVYQGIKTDRLIKKADITSRRASLGLTETIGGYYDRNDTNKTLSRIVVSGGSYLPEMGISVPYFLDLSATDSRFNEYKKRLKQSN